MSVTFFRDATCGKIQCLTSASKPIESNAVGIETTVTVGNKKLPCMGTHVYKPGQEDEEAQGDTLDPGLVMTGTKCGIDSVSLDMCGNIQHSICLTELKDTNYRNSFTFLTFLSALLTSLPLSLDLF